MNLENIKIIREKTNAPVMKVKEALSLCNNDVDKAIDWLKENWRPKDKETAFGKIYTYNHQGRIGVMLEVRCGTDFVAMTQEFNDLCHELALQVVAGLDGPIEKQTWVKDTNKIVQDLIGEVSKKMGETIRLDRFVRWTV
jgi:elongation factor Ts